MIVLMVVWFQICQHFFVLILQLLEASLTDINKISFRIWVVSASQADITGLTDLQTSFIASVAIKEMDIDYFLGALGLNVVAQTLGCKLLDLTRQVDAILFVPIVVICLCTGCLHAFFAAELLAFLPFQPIVRIHKILVAFPACRLLDFGHFDRFDNALLNCDMFS
jgi:hypothetical protein